MRFSLLSISQLRWIGNPHVELQRALAGAAELADPLANLGGRVQECAHRAHAARVGDRNRQAHRTGARHRCEQNRKIEAVRFTERISTIARTEVTHGAHLTLPLDYDTPRRRGTETLFMAELALHREGCS